MSCRYQTKYDHIGNMCGICYGRTHVHYKHILKLSTQRQLTYNLLLTSQEERVTIASKLGLCITCTQQIQSISHLLALAAIFVSGYTR